MQSVVVVSPRVLFLSDLNVFTFERVKTLSVTLIPNLAVRLDIFEVLHFTVDLYRCAISE